MKTKILLDIDGVIGNFVKAFSTHLNNQLDAGLDPEKDPPVYNMSRWGHDLPGELIKREVPLWMEAGGYAEMPIYPGAKEFVYKLMDKYDVYIVTARIGDFKMNLPESLKAIIRRDTERWFKKHGIPSDKLFFEHQKVDFCKQNGISCIVEDKLSTVVKGANAGLCTILIDRGWNQQGDAQAGEGHLNRDHPNIHVAYSYDDVLDKLEQLVE